MAVGFDGWPESAVEFYEGLELDKSKAYWIEHRAVYECDVRGPMDSLLAELEPEFGAAKVFRPYRDVRFSSDKSPYKTACGAGAYTEGGAALYLQVSADGLMAGSGYYHMDRDQLERYRAAVAADESGKEVEAAVEELERSGFDILGEALKTAPRGYPKDHPRIRLLKHKGLVMWRQDPPGGVLHSPDAVAWVAECWRAARPLNDWLSRYVGRAVTD